MKWVVGVIFRGTWDPDENVYPLPADVCLDLLWFEALDLDWASCGWERR